MPRKLSSSRKKREQHRRQKPRRPASTQGSTLMRALPMKMKRASPRIPTTKKKRMNPRTKKTSTSRISKSLTSKALVPKRSPTVGMAQNLTLVATIVRKKKAKIETTLATCSTTQSPSSSRLASITYSVSTTVSSRPMTTVASHFGVHVTGLCATLA